MGLLPPEIRWLVHTLAACGPGSSAPGAVLNASCVLTHSHPKRQVVLPPPFYRAGEQEVEAARGPGASVRLTKAIDLTGHALN